MSYLARPSRRSRGALAALVLAALMTLGATSSVEAQDAAPAASSAEVCRGIDAPSAPVVRAGREEFVLGVTALEEERWADAERAFRRAYELNRSPVTLHNLGVALRALNRHLEAREAFCRVALDTRVEDAEMREQAAQFAREAANRLASVVVDRVEPSISTMTLDDRPMTLGPLPFVLEIDADVAHVVAFEARGYLRQAIPVELTPGATRHLAVDLEALPSGGDELVPLVIGIIVGVVVIGAGIGAWVGYEQSQLQPVHPSLVNGAL